jgi:hypothetical protein
MRLQERDKQIMIAIFRNEGILTVRHIFQLFWPGKTLRAVQRRLAILIKNEYLGRPTRKDYKTRPIPEPVCFLGWRGILVVASLMGVDVKQPKVITETNLRKLYKTLRDKGIRWVREPRWSLLRHDVAVSDFRYALEHSLQNMPAYRLENWLSDYIFRTDTDEVSYRVVNRDGSIVPKKKGVIPDAYFEIVDQNRLVQGENIRARFLLEMDMATHDRNRFCSDKAIPGVAYIKSAAYRQRFGSNNGFWLVVCVSGRRMKFLRKQVVERTAEESDKFFFTSLDQVLCEDILTTPIWLHGDGNQTRALLDNP